MIVRSFLNALTQRSFRINATRIISGGILIILQGCVSQSSEDSSNVPSLASQGLYANASTTCANNKDSIFCSGITQAGMISRYYGDTMAGKYDILPKPNPTLRYFTQLSLGTFHGCGIKNEQLYCWGLNHAGQLGGGTKINSETPVLVDIGNVRQVVVGTFHTCALNIQGEVFCWGYNEFGQLGNGTVRNSSAPTKVLSISNINKITAGGDHSCAVNINGQVHCWGWNSSGQIGVNTFQPYYTTPISIQNDQANKFSDITAGSYHTCAIAFNKQVYCWGLNGRTQSSPKVLIKNIHKDQSPLDIKSVEINQNIVKLYFLSIRKDWVFCATSGTQSLCKSMDGDGVVTFGLLDLNYDNTYLIKAKALDDRIVDWHQLPEISIELNDSEFNNLNGKQSITMTFNAETVDLKWPKIGGGAYYDIFYNFQGDYSLANASNFSVSRVSSRNNMSLPFSQADSSFSYFIEGVYLGAEDGQLGNGSYYNARRPTSALSSANFNSVVANYAETCALDDRNQLYCWGRSYNTNIPKLIESNVAQFAMGGEYLCLRLASDLKLISCRGSNYYGQLGNRTQIDQSAFSEFLIPKGN